jgi:CHAT domain-containing protein
VAGARSATWLDPAELERFDVVHLAGHATVDDEHPWLSGLLLVPAGPQGEAQYLRAARIAEMRLPAHLVVLSSCVSGAGQLIAGEGVIGLSSAFLTAGVPAVVATLWAVDDRTTARLMSRFYDALQRGASAATALSEAQRALRRSPDTRHPFYWAGFVLVGDGGVRVALTQRPAWTAWYWARLAALGAVVAAALLAGWRSARARAGADGAAA